MFLMAKDVLTAAEIQELTRIAGGLPFVDGRVSNPHSLAKNNLQADIAQPDTGRAAQTAGEAIMRKRRDPQLRLPQAHPPRHRGRHDQG